MQSCRNFVNTENCYPSENLSLLSDSIKKHQRTASIQKLFSSDSASPFRYILCPARQEVIGKDSQKPTSRNKIFEALLFALITAFIHLKTYFKKCVLLGYLLKKEGTAIFFWNRPHVLLVKIIFCGVLVLLIFFRKLGGIKHQFALFLIVFRESSMGN